MQSDNLKQNLWFFRAHWIPARTFLLYLILAGLFTAKVRAEDTSSQGTNQLSQLADMDISQLMQVNVSILGPEESVSRTPAAVSVITQQQISQSGAMNFPEALRLVPGLDVAQVDASQWAVSARGFNDIFANKLLVLQDGRDLYTPLYSGVFWDAQGTMMEDVDQIEVVRGPGATLWGANAMNGVINVVTKNSADTQGLLASGGGGNQEQGFANVRYGGMAGSNLSYRVYGTYENHDASVYPDGSGANDSWQTARGGFRTDWVPTGDNKVMLQGSGYAGWINQVFGVTTGPVSPTSTNTELMRIAGADVLGKWRHEISDTAHFSFQAYYDYNQRNAPWVFAEQLHTFDLEFKNEFTLGNRNQVDWGLGYRINRDMEVNSPDISFNPANATLNFYSAYIQDQLTLVPDQLSLTFGTKLEHNDYTGFDEEPSVRLLWTPTPRQTFWGSISKAVRIPSRADESIMLLHPEGFPVTLNGSASYTSEDMVAYEAGYRSLPSDTLSLDLSAFYDDYTHLGSIEASPTQPGQWYGANDLYGETYGMEVSATWSMTPWWKWTPSYSLLKYNLQSRSAYNNPLDGLAIAQIEGTSPENQVSLGSSMVLPRGIHFDTTLRYVDRLSYFNINSYVEMDSRLAWQVNPHLEVALVGQNLLHNQHAEFGPTYINTQAGQITQIPRSVYLKVTYQF